ncbi:hypothetical protein EJB05_37131 [Eragrostis curvula]|uniref:TF-B3 domain-containing protein n=1 Tax=Eragrostis curvula TaxID=38414 RepID=A0A5J9TSM7_9POAL|nr:hypothetical protein EJB05_37131 [Eragrostis curvula]
MAPSGDHGTAKAKDLRVLLPFSCDRLRIPDELAGEIGGGKALVVGQYGGRAKVWHVEVGRDGDGAFLGRGWPEFADACGVGAGCRLVLRHRGRGLLTVKAFDDSGCLTELGAPARASPPAAQGTTSSTDTSGRPQFISALPPGSMDKMLMPSKFVEQYVAKERLNKRMAIVAGPLGKVCPIELEINWSGVFFAAGWSKFLALHGVCKGNSLLLRYEGNMVLTVKVFGADGCQSKSKHKDVKIQQCVEERQDPLYDFAWKCRSKNDWASSEGEKKPTGSTTSLPKASFMKKSVYEIGPPSWIMKQINANVLKDQLALAPAFCDGIGLKERCAITLKTSMNSNESWQVHYIPCKSKSPLGQGWPKFSRENNLELGDICTFHVVETTCLPPVFCEAVGIRKPSNVMLKTSMSSTRSWQAHVVPYKNSSHHVARLGWKCFCLDNGIKAGDILTSALNLFENVTWQVDNTCPIARTR